MHTHTYVYTHWPCSVLFFPLHHHHHHHHHDRHHVSRLPVETTTDREEEGPKRHMKSKTNFRFSFLSLLVHIKFIVLNDIRTNALNIHIHTHR